MGRPSHDKPLHGNIASLLTHDCQDPCRPCRGDPLTPVHAASTPDNPRALLNRGTRIAGEGDKDSLFCCADTSLHDCLHYCPSSAISEQKTLCRRERAACRCCGTKGRFSETERVIFRAIPEDPDGCTGEVASNSSIFKTRSWPAGEAQEGPRGRWLAHFHHVSEQIHQ